MPRSDHFDELLSGSTPFLPAPNLT